MLAEVEVVFGFWAAVLIAFMAFKIGASGALGYLESRNFTEPAFVFVIMVIAASKPVIDFAALLLRSASLALPLPGAMAYFFTLLAVGPLLGRGADACGAAEAFASPTATTVISVVTVATGGGDAGAAGGGVVSLPPPPPPPGRPESAVA